MNTKGMVLAALFAALVAVLGLMPPIPTPITPVPITAQTLGVMLAGGFLGMKLGGISMGLFVLLVAAGAPLLAGGRGGLGVIASPTGGFFLSWPIIAMFIGWAVERMWNSLTTLKLFFINVVIGMLLIYLIGATYQSWITGVPLTVTLLGTTSFLIGDSLKAAAAAILIMQVKSLSPINERKHEPKNQTAEAA
ncbi:biotin transport system substrate-specific component [Salsuginibacillus halophilus]|uniref:Biotin transporter n=1 Tax=Salsuginibacillus halophilus TaxID=517424 RepID=A0A2P8HKX9_9BACI|nr:biotin transporter BioY [Salsuginibacillus halophilus]PSL46866.1 biotin transport system substrate-specific component [Salsuginibacillus halophilus]